MGYGGPTPSIIHRPKILFFCGSGAATGYNGALSYVTRLWRNPMSANIQGQIDALKTALHTVIHESDDRKSIRRSIREMAEMLSQQHSPDYQKGYNEIVEHLLKGPE